MTSATIWGIVAPLLGIIGTIIAYKLNPRRAILAELDNIAAQKHKWEEVRDEALKENNNDDLTIANAMLVQLRDRRAELLQRLSKSV